MKKILFIVGGSALLLISMVFGAFFAGPLMASAQSTQGAATTATPTTTTNTYCQQYMQDLANSLHVSVATLQQDQQGAKEAIVAQLVKDGKLTQAQADAINKRIASHQACSGKGKTWWDNGILRQTLTKYKTTLGTQVAQGLHLTAAQLQSDLQKGQTLKQIAKAQKVTEKQLHTIVLNAVHSTLDQAQKAGDITSAQETAFNQFLQKHPGVVNHWLDHKFNKAKK